MTQSIWSLPSVVAELMALVSGGVEALGARAPTVFWQCCQTNLGCRFSCHRWCCKKAWHGADTPPPCQISQVAGESKDKEHYSQEDIGFRHTVELMAKNSSIDAIHDALVRMNAWFTESRAVIEPTLSPR